MKFLEARALVAGFAGGPALSFRLGMSGTADPLLLFIRAAAAQRGYAAEVETIPFGTLNQALFQPGTGREVFLLFPWDLCAEADWRSGTPAESVDAAEVIASARQVLVALSRRPDASVLYVPAVLPPLERNAGAARSLGDRLKAEALAAGATCLLPDHFSLESYYRSGFPLAADAQGVVAGQIVSAALGQAKPSAKVLVTDFDNTLWAGVVGEDGPEGVHQQPEGAGYVHFTYQSYLRALRRSGVLLAAVSRNDADLALAPLRGGRSLLTEDDFVAVVASYNSKSAQIIELARSLNLGLDAFVFVDDNPVELAEVTAAIPELQAVQFPRRAADLPELLWRLAELFHRTDVTREDREKTELYRRRLAGIVPVEQEGADVTSFLAGLDMHLTVHDRSHGDRTRAVQLINKTNQFNLNGIRRSAEEVEAILAGGGSLTTVTLTDRHGSHGEILAFLVDGTGMVRSFVLSCRVFQRRVEDAFMIWLAERGAWPRGFEFQETERNEPFRRFLENRAFAADDRMVRADASVFLEVAGEARKLFTISHEAGSVRA